MIRYFYVLAILAWIPACGPEQGSENQAHDEIEAVTVTQWTDHLELFMEYVPPVKGGTSEFLIHLTELDNFAPIGSGTVKLQSRGPDGTARSVVTDTCIRPGIYRVKMDFPADGHYSLLFLYNGTDFSDTCDLPDVTTLGVKDSPGAEKHVTAAGEIVFLKEQQWDTKFATVWADMRRLQSSIPASAEISSPPGKVIEIAAPVSGFLLPKLNSSFPSPGSPVKRGAILAVISADPGNVQGLEQVRAEYLNAKADVERVGRLHAKGAVSARRLGEARTRFEAARSGYELLEKSDIWAASETESVLRITAPISGYVERINMRPGEHVSSGKVLCVLADPARLLLNVSVPVAHASALARISDARFRIEGFPDTWRISLLNGKLLSRGRIVDEQTRTLRVTFVFDNPRGLFSIGMFADAWVETGETDSVLAIPLEAVLDEGDGVYNVFVQVEGESFERRRISPGRRSEGYVEISAGLQRGERIVTHGAYQIHLTSLAGSVPEHGHTH